MVPTKQPTIASKTTMKAAQASGFGDAHDVLIVSPSVAVPPPPAKSHVQIAVHACSLSPSDYRMLSGSASMFKKPPHWPYIPGGDVSGVVVAVPDDDGQRQGVAGDGEAFRVGDRVMGTWDGFGIGGMAEVINVHTRFVERLPEGLTHVQGAALADSSVNAMLACEDAQLQSSDRLLVLGGSGAAGTAVIQLATRHYGVTTVVATSTDEALCRRLGATAVINYRETEWCSHAAVREAAPFDVVIDCAEGVRAWKMVRAHGLVKTRSQGGRFMALVINEWDIMMTRPWHLVTFMGRMVCRTLVAWCCRRSMARYAMVSPAPRGDSLRRLLDIMRGNDKLEVVIDTGSPLPLTTDGVRQAFDTMINRRAHGKVVIKIREDDA